MCEEAMFLAYISLEKFGNYFLFLLHSSFFHSSLTYDVPTMCFAFIDKHPENTELNKLRKDSFMM